MKTTNTDEQSRGDRTPGGFTIVELLIVVGIITILIAILLPALTKARKYSQQLACASNLRQIVLATINYAAENKNRIPETFRQPGYDLDKVSCGTAFGAYFSYTATANPSPAANSANINRLVEKGYLSGLFLKDDPETSVPWLWCPSAIDGTSAAPGNTTGTGGDPISSYFYNPHIRVTGPAGNTPQGSRYTRIDKIPRNRCLVCDQVYYQDSFYHLTKSDGSTAGWNMGFPDGHVVFIESKDLTQCIRANSVGAGWFDTHTAKAGWAVDFIETIADGGDPTAQSIMFPVASAGQFAGPNVSPYYGMRNYGTGPRIKYGNNEVEDQLP